MQVVALQQLLVLHVVLEEGSVARAARRLHVTPSAVSNALAKVRDELGDPLVVRSGRGVVPTPRAVALAPVLAQAFSSLQTAIRPPVFDKRQVNRTFVLAVADAGQITRVPTLVQRLTQTMPKARLQVVGIDALEALGGLAHEVDVVIGPSEHGAGVHTLELGVERAVLVARERHPRARSRVSRGQLVELQHVGVVGAVANRADITAAAWAAAGVTRTLAVTVSTFAAAAAIAATTDLVATLPEAVLRKLQSTLSLRRLRGPIPVVEVRHRLAWHERNHAHPDFIAFRALVAKVWGAVHTP